LSGNALYLVIAIALIAYLFVQRPTADKINKNLPLTLEEQKQFDNLQG
jgi:flagellar biosynthesis protein FliP